jgi:hypothetical protein
MSSLISFETLCPACKHPNEAEVWAVVNVKTDPELKDLLLGGELNMIECAACKEIFYAEHFLLYHDPAYELMAFVYPDAYQTEKPEWEEKTKRDFAASQSSLPENERLSYAPVTLFGLDQLVFIVEEEEEASIQGEIVSLLSPEHHFQIRGIRPSVARATHFPPVLPYIRDAGLSPRDAVLRALDKIKVANDRLTVYSKLESQIRENPAMEIPVDLKSA